MAGGRQPSKAEAGRQGTHSRESFAQGECVISAKGSAKNDTRKRAPTATRPLPDRRWSTPKAKRTATPRTRGAAVASLGGLTHQRGLSMDYQGSRPTQTPNPAPTQRLSPATPNGPSELGSRHRIPHHSHLCAGLELTQRGEPCPRQSCAIHRRRAWCVHAGR